MGKAQKGQEMRPMKLIIEQLNFDESQKKEFIKLVDSHKKEIKEVHQKIMSSKKNLYQELKNENASLDDSLLTIIANEVKEIEKAHFNHFLEIKELCNEEQKVQFAILADELSIIFQPRKPKHPRNDN